MILTLQIAAGIVLAYAIIANRQVLLKSTKLVAVIGGSLLAVGALVWGASAAVGALQPHIGPILSKALDIMGGLVILGIGGVGGYGLWKLIHILLRRERKPMADFMFPMMAVANVVLVWAASWPLLAYTVVGDWYEAVDHWSRANGYADGGVIVVASIFWLWPFVPLRAISKRRARPAAEPLMVYQPAPDATDHKL